MRDATVNAIGASSIVPVSIHASRAGRDPTQNCIEKAKERFNPRVPCGTRPRDEGAFKKLDEFQSTRPVRDATFLGCFTFQNAKVSIHASRAGRDFPCRYQPYKLLFQSTRPVRDATHQFDVPGRDNARFNPRVPCGTRRDWTPEDYAGWLVSIHASRAGRDPRIRRTTAIGEVSIHASRAGRDGQGWRPGKTGILFQSTRPVRDATHCLSQFFRDLRVSIHASRAGRDSATALTVFNALRFQSTRPVRDATAKLRLISPVVPVSIHASRAGRDYLFLKYEHIYCVSIHASRAGRDHRMLC